MHENYCELKSALNLKAEEEALERENPFESMHQSVLHAGSTVPVNEGDTQEDTADFSDDDDDDDGAVDLDETRDQVDDADFENECLT